MPQKPHGCVSLVAFTHKDKAYDALHLLNRKEENACFAVSSAPHMKIKQNVCPLIRIYYMYCGNCTVLLRRIYTMRICRIQQAYDRPMT